MRKLLLCGLVASCVQVSCGQTTKLNTTENETSRVLPDSIVYHPVRVDESGQILPWYSANLGESYDYVLDRVWNFWKKIETDSNGQPYYMNHQVWAPGHDKRGLGGDQLMMALSSWDLYYNYTGDASLIENMRYMADYYLAHSLSPANAAWPYLPFPYNMDVESGIYDGDMILGKEFLQPDKAGSFGFELIHLYKKTGEKKYLDAAVKIANTLADKVHPGDNDHSPWPFKVNAITGDTGILVNQEVWYEGMSEDLKKKKGAPNHKKSTYTTNWTGALGMFAELMQLKEGNTSAYKKAFQIALDWMKQYPAKTNKWGPFFEDVPRWSDTQINATTFAMYLLEHPELDKNWKQTVLNILNWVYSTLGNKQYSKYGVICINEQTAYPVPGNSHSSRQASIDLMYAEKTGDTSFVRNAIRELNWATYMVDEDGKNFYPTNAIWMTDGYGDYVRHYLRAMAAAPELAPADKDHLLRTSSIVSKISYTPNEITYSTFDGSSKEIFRLTAKPSSVKAGGKELAESNSKAGWSWRALDKGGVLTVSHDAAKDVVIAK
jgi:hypothetical protein